MSIEVLKPGIYSMFQDLGRVGFQHLGVPVCGAMDEIAHRIANLLVGNPQSEATLEITLIGPSLRFGETALIAICGADLGAVLIPPGGEAANSVAVPLDTPTRIAAGATLQYGKRRSGLRSYLAVHGGFGLPVVMGSRSTYVRGGFGGFEGRPLRKGDQLALPALPELAAPAADLLSQLLPAIVAGMPMRATIGREWQQFTSRAQAAFFAEAASVGSQSERMAYRMLGPVLERLSTEDILSEAVAFGTVQVPPDGRPMVLMADRQSSGGYPRIAQVAHVDLPRLAQVMPGESIRFARIEPEQAQELLLQRSVLLTKLAEILSPAAASSATKGAHA